MTEVKTEGIVVKRQKFENAMTSIENFSKKANTNTKLEKVEGNFFGTVKEKNINIFVSQVEDRLIELKNFDLGTLDIITNIYKALDALDKEHISGILIAANSAKAASDKANENVKAIEKIIKVLQKFKDSLEKLEHLMDADKAWEILEEQKIIINSLCDYKDKITSIKHLVDIDELWEDSNSHSKTLDDIKNELEKIHKLLDEHQNSISGFIKTVETLANNQQILAEETSKKLTEQQVLIEDSLKENKSEIQKGFNAVEKMFNKNQEAFENKFIAFSKSQEDFFNSMQKKYTDALLNIEKLQSEAIESLSTSQTKALDIIEKTQSEKLKAISKEYTETLSNMVEEQKDKFDSMNAFIQSEKELLNKQSNLLSKKMKIAYIIAGSSAAITLLHIILNILGVI